MDKYITKFDYDRTRGFQVRVPCVIDGVLIPYSEQVENKFFKKGTGTWKAAREKAIIWRDDYLKENNIERLLKIRFNRIHPMKNSIRNTSGVIGIIYVENVKWAGVYYGYAATWCVGGVQKRRQFSVNLYGEKDAFLKACRLRFRHSGILIITDVKAIPCLPDVDYKIQEK